MRGWTACLNAGPVLTAGYGAGGSAATTITWATPTYHALCQGPLTSWPDGSLQGYVLIACHGNWAGLLHEVYLDLYYVTVPLHVVQTPVEGSTTTTNNRPATTWVPRLIRGRPADTLRGQDLQRSPVRHRRVQPRTARRTPSGRVWLRVAGPPGPQQTRWQTASTALMSTSPRPLTAKSTTRAGTTTNTPSTLTYPPSRRYLLRQVAPTGASTYRPRVTPATRPRTSSRYRRAMTARSLGRTYARRSVVAS